MAFIINVIKWLLWTVETMYYVCIPFWNHADVRNTMWLVNTPSKHETFTQCPSNAGPPSATLAPASNEQWFNASCLLIAAGLVVLTAGLQADTDPCWVSVAGAGQYPFSPSQHFMRAYTVFWKGCDRQCCRQRNGSICLFHKCAYYRRNYRRKGCDRQKRAQWRQRKGSIYLIYKWAHTAFWRHCYTQDRYEWDTQTHILRQTERTEVNQNFPTFVYRGEI